ncbi:unnamed protein product [Ilex paraguariensis]|uniref:LisH domain-containing protein n=1 Tax=Ilex paraguariensis TaxID=185542 RepID=A0ABC8QVT6_9AQUA
MPQPAKSRLVHNLFPRGTEEADNTNLFLLEMPVMKLALTIFSLRCCCHCPSMDTAERILFPPPSKGPSERLVSNKLRSRVLQYIYKEKMNVHLATTSFDLLMYTFECESFGVCCFR